MTIQLHESSLVVDALNSQQSYCVYEHFIGDPEEVIYLNVCRLIDVHRLTDARANSEWAAMFARGGSVGVRVIATSQEKQELMRWATIRLRSMPKQPRCNLMGHTLFGAIRRVRCLTNGVTYESQAAAAEALGLAQSAISRHLRGELKAVKGHIFESINVDRAMAAAIVGESA